MILDHLKSLDIDTLFPENISMHLGLFLNKCSFVPEYKYQQVILQKNGILKDMTSSLYCIMNTLRTNHRVGKLNSQNLYPPHIGLNQYHIQLCQENVLPTSKSNTFVWNIVKMYFTALVVNLFLESAIPWGKCSVFAITWCFGTNTYFQTCYRQLLRPSVFETNEFYFDISSWTWKIYVF